MDHESTVKKLSNLLCSLLSCATYASMAVFRAHTQEVALQFLSGQQTDLINDIDSCNLLVHTAVFNLVAVTRPARC